jgi:hypothetical protein
MVSSGRNEGFVRLAGDVGQAKRRQRARQGAREKNSNEINENDPTEP